MEASNCDLTLSVDFNCKKMQKPIFRNFILTFISEETNGNALSQVVVVILRKTRCRLVHSLGLCQVKIGVKHVKRKKRMKEGTGGELVIKIDGVGIHKEIYTATFT